MTCHQPPAPLTDYRGAAVREPSEAQLRVRLDRLQTVRRAARQESAPTDADRRLSPPPGPDWTSPLTPRLHSEDTAEDADDEDSEDSEDAEDREGSRARRSSVGRELGAVADRLDARRTLGAQTQLPTRRPVSRRLPIPPPPSGNGHLGPNQTLLDHNRNTCGSIEF